MSSACALVAFSALALAQNRPPVAECKATETQAECHARLKCKPDEELETCKKRVGAEAAKKANPGQQGDPANNGRDDRRDPDDDRRDRDPDDDRRDDRRDRDPDDDRRDRRRDRDPDDDRRDRRADDDGGDRGDRGRSRRQRGRDRGGRGRGFEANKTFGLGLELGQPSGLNGKYFLSDAAALDFGIGAIYGHYYYGNGLHIYGDFLWHPLSLVSASAFELPLYIGGGLRFWSFNYCDDRDRICDYGGSAIGLRVPIGVAFDFNRVPLDIFIQLVPVIDFVSGDYYDRYRDRSHFGIDLSAGIRYWFK